MTRDWSTIPKQTFLRENGQVGDCWRCCIAAILNLPADQVPHFVLDDKENNGCSVEWRTQEWLYARGYTLLEAPRISIRYSRDVNPEYPKISCGPSPRSTKIGQHHAVVSISDNIVYDPHPSGAGLTAVTNEFMIVPLLK